MNSTSQLFTIRNKLLSSTPSEFKKIIDEKAQNFSREVFENLAKLVYEKIRNERSQYIILFSQYQPSILNLQVTVDRRLIEDIVLYGQLKQIREIFAEIVNSKASLQEYSMFTLIGLALERKNINQASSFISQILNYKKYFANSGEMMQSTQDEEYYLVKYALEKNMLTTAYDLLQKRIGKLKNDNEQLFELNKIKNKKQPQFTKFIELYFDLTKCNPKKMNKQGDRFYDKFPQRQREAVEAIIAAYEKSSPQKKQQHNIRRSENKVRSSMGLGQNLKQYSNEPLNNNSKQKLVITIQNMEDQISIQKQAGKIFQSHINEKQKYYKLQKMQSKEIKQGRVGIMKSEQLRYYLQKDIEYQVAKIKQQNNRYRDRFVQVLNRIKQKLTNTLNIQLEVFGSFCTSLCLPESDIDIVAVPNSKDDQVDKVTFLSEIKIILQTMTDEIQSVNYINTASVPIIKVVCTAQYGHKKIDITKKTEQHNGLQSVKLIKEYLELYPPLESLTFILKKFIYVSGLSAPYKGGISSYALVLMIVAFMQNEYKNYQTKKLNKSEILVADLLIGFLKFYGFKMNYVMKSIELFDIHNPNSWKNYGGCLSPYSDPKNPAIDLQPKLVIIDPLNQTNNVGRSTHKIKQIQMAFEIAYICIHTYKQCGKKRRCESYRKIINTNIEDVKFNNNQRPCCMLKRMFNCTEKFIKE